MDGARDEYNFQYDIHDRQDKDNLISWQAFIDAVDAMKMGKFMIVIICPYSRINHKRGRTDDLEVIV